MPTSRCCFRCAIVARAERLLPVAEALRRFLTIARIAGPPCTPPWRRRRIDARCLQIASPPSFQACCADQHQGEVRRCACGQAQRAAMLRPLSLWRQLAAPPLAQRYSAFAIHRHLTPKIRSLALSRSGVLRMLRRVSTRLTKPFSTTEGRRKRSWCHRAGKFRRHQPVSECPQSRAATAATPDPHGCPHRASPSAAVFVWRMQIVRRKHRRRRPDKLCPRYRRGQRIEHWRIGRDCYWSSFASCP